MAPRSSSGTCLLCRAPVTKRGALKHGMECLQSSGWPTGKKSSLLIRIQGRDEKNYWMVVLARYDALLADLDQLIRDVWVECCGHLSAFQIGGVSYASDDEDSENTMNVFLSGIVSPGSVFSYDYDFGSTTTLELKVIGETPVVPQEGLLCLIARNDRPTIPCDRCDGAAEFILTDIDEWAPICYCRACLASTDPDLECVDIIANSPRNGVCGYFEDPVAALRWYPPGWSEEEIIPGDLEEFLDSLGAEDTSFDDDAGVHAAIDLVNREIGLELDAFFEAEEAAYGLEAAGMAGESVLMFCTFMYNLHGAKVGEWDAGSVRRCLIEDMALNPIFPETWSQNVVPILCRFLTRLEASGRLTNASDLIAALKEAEPAFLGAVDSPEKYRNLFRRILVNAQKTGINLNDMDAFLNFAMGEIIKMAGMDPDDENIRKELSGMLRDDRLEVGSDDLRAAMILIRCEEFCDRFEDETVVERCKEFIMDLLAHPAAPLSRGDGVLWSAALVYAACRDANLIRPGRGGPPLAQEIGSFFNLEVPSIRTRVTALRKLLPVQKTD
ncbi:MAG: hypothetical protein PWP08_573 [Methanofollis sp.]|nr:hypothetical protein [Methanofollis sp.]